MSKYLKYGILVIGLIVMSSFSRTPMQEIDPCSIENNSFQAGEHIVYKIYYNWGYLWISAGEVDFKIEETSENYVITATGSTYKSYDIFFKVRDVYQTIINKKTMLPVQFERNVQEGGYRHYNRLEFNHNNGTVMSFDGRTKETVVAREYPIESCMQDMLSTVYFLRNIAYAQLREIGTLPVKMFIDDKIYPIDVSYQKEEVKKIDKFGKMSTVKISPQVVAGVVFKEAAKMNIWVSNDKNKIPLIIESPISVGSIQARIKSHRGLKYPLGK